jgi:uncharacterized protein (DUF2345 family)
VAKASNSSKNITSSAVRFTITASGKDQVVLTGATVTLTSNYAFSGTSTGTIKIYKNSVSDSNLV